MKKKKGPLFVIFMTIFIDLIGFGMIIPLSPYLARDFGATPTEVGLLMSIYSFMQFLFSPFWGRLSDKIGRRPVLLVSLFGSSFSYLIFAFSPNMTWLFISRMLAGIFAANISTAMAYIADVTSKADRSKGMGLIGAAFGLGFIFGPFFGGILGDWGLRLGDHPPFGISFSALWASALCFVNLLVATRTLKESLTPEIRKQAQARKSRWAMFKKFSSRPVLPAMISIFFLSGLAMAHMESTLFLYVKDQFGWGMRLASYGFAYVGVIIVFTQGFLIRKILPKFGERKLLTLGLLSGAFGLISTGFASSIAMLACVQTLLALGVGMVNPSVLGSVSQLVSEEEQGEVMGFTQSFGALARILGPALGGFYYGHLGISSPFIIGGAMMAVGAVIALLNFKKIPQGAKKHSAGAGPTGSGVYSIKDGDVTMISTEQLEALIYKRVLFAFFDLRVGAGDHGGQISQHKTSVYKTALPATKENIFKQVAATVTSKDHPIVIICEDGKLSTKVAGQLHKQGYINVSVLQDGAGK